MIDTWNIIFSSFPHQQDLKMTEETKNPLSYVSSN